MSFPSPQTFSRVLRYFVLASIVLALVGCVAGTKLQPPTASIQQLTVNSNGSWTAIVRFQNYSYDTGMHVYAIDADLSLNGKPAGHVAFPPALDIPAMDADIASVTFTPDAAGAAALTAAKHNAIQYDLKGSLSVGKGTTGSAQPFKLDGKGYISPVPGVSNIWR
ncbi:MAG TPA: LEA type 2 family protein [Rhodanobacteraceae bacterium]